METVFFKYPKNGLTVSNHGGMVHAASGRILVLKDGRRAFVSTRISIDVGRFIRDVRRAGWPGGARRHGKLEDRIQAPKSWVRRGKNNCREKCI